MIFWGYTLIITVVVLLIFLAEKVFNRFIGEEYCRKILHIGTFFVFPIASVFLGNGSIHFVVICAIFSIITLLLYISKKFKTIDLREKSYPGIFYYAFSLLVISLICHFNKQYHVFFGVAFIGLAIGDGFATLMGYTFKGIKIYKEKTLIGFISCFFATGMSLVIYSLLNQWFLSPIQILLISFFVSIVELVDFGLDNLVIPLLSFFISVWITQSNLALIGLAIFVGVFFIAYFLKIITYYGALASSLIGFLFYYYGGSRFLIFVLCCYGVMMIVSLISKHMKNDLSKVVKKTGKKDFVEIFVNGIWAVVAIIVYAISNNQTFLPISLVVMSAGFADSLASDVGSLSKSKPYDFIKRKYVDKGVSGGTTFLGSIASFIGAAIFAFAIKFICDLPYYQTAIMCAIIYFGVVVDSLLGSTIQVKFECEECGKITEKETHCGKETKMVEGIKFINNDVVNCLSGLSVFMCSLILLLI